MEKIEQEFAETNLALKIWCLRGRIFGGWSGNGIQGKIQAAPKPIRSADLVSLPVQMLDYAHRAIFHMPLERHLILDLHNVCCTQPGVAICILMQQVDCANKFAG